MHRCGEIFEAFQKVNDEPVNRCKFCGGGVDKLFSHTSFQLKGSGWYLTDYSRKSQPADGGNGTGGKDSKPPGGKESSGSTESSTVAPSPSKAAENKT